MNKINRVFMVSGTLHAAMAIALIKNAGNDDMYRNYAFIAFVFVNKSENGAIVSAIKSILDSCSFEQINDITGIEVELRALFEKEKFSECEKMIKKEMDIDKVDQLFVYDNSKHPLANMIGRTFNQSHITIFGDGLGFIRASIGQGFCHIDEIVTFLPIDFSKGFSEKIPLKIIDKNIFYSVCDEYYNKNEGFRNAIEKYNTLLPKNSVVLMLQQFTEFMRMDFDKEMSMYIKAVERNCEKGDTIVLKSHPRATAVKRNEFLTEELNKIGFNVISLDDDELKLMPIEMICRFLKFKNAVCTSSTAGIPLKYFYGMDVDISVDEDDIRNYKKGNEYFSIYMSGLTAALKNLDNWKGDSILYTYPINPLNYEPTVKSLIYITVEDALHTIITGFYMKNRRISDFFTEKGIKNVALYGISKVGCIIAEDLANCNDINLYLLDRSKCGGTYLDRPVHYFDTLKEQIDCVFIATTHSVDEIKAMTEKYTDCKKVFCLSDLK